MNCAAEITQQTQALGISFDAIVHCTGSSSTQAGLLAGFAALGQKIDIVGIADDDETVVKTQRIHQLANNALSELGLAARVDLHDVEVLAFDQNVYGKADPETRDGIRLLAQTEGLIADPVYEAKAVRGLLTLAREGRFEKGSRILLMHLGGSPALHAYANQFDPPMLKPFSIESEENMRTNL